MAIAVSLRSAEALGSDGAMCRLAGFGRLCILKTGVKSLMTKQRILSTKRPFTVLADEGSSTSIYIMTRSVSVS